VAPHPGEQAGVADDLALGRVQAQPLAHAESDQRLPDHVLNRLTEPQVGAQREHGHQLGEAELRVQGGHASIIPEGIKAELTGEEWCTPSPRRS
jgi:hypothetical protein